MYSPVSLDTRNVLDWPFSKLTIKIKGIMINIMPNWFPSKVQKSLNEQNKTLYTHEWILYIEIN